MRKRFDEFEPTGVGIQKDLALCVVCRGVGIQMLKYSYDISVSPCNWEIFK